MKTPEQRAKWAAYMRDYYRRNPEKAKAAREKRREKRIAESKAWRARNQDKVIAYRQLAEVKAKSNIRAAKYKRDNPLKRREWEARRRARINSSKVEAIDYNKLVANADGMCGICGELLGDSAIQFDHIIPLAQKGTHTMSNLQVAHATCNWKKGAKFLA